MASGQLRTQDAFSPPSGVRRNPDSVRCPVSRNKFMFISFKTWRAIGASSCTAFSTCGAAVRTVPKILKMAY